MKKKLAVFAAVGMAVLLSACSSSSTKSYVFDVDTGDSIEVSLDTSAGLKLFQDGGSFGVSDNKGNNIIQGSFINAEGYSMYADEVESAAKTDNTDTVIEDEGDDYLYWYTYRADGGIEYDRIVKVTDDTGIIMASMSDKDLANQAYGSLSFAVTD